METRAILKHARLSPRKVRRVVDLIRGRKAGEAMVSLRFMPYRAAKTVEKVLKSAMANAEQADAGMDVEEMLISQAFVDNGPIMKRMRARAMGRANTIRKRSSHITLYLSSKDGE
jgi:large subunit ribosomal protein L22